MNKSDELIELVQSLNIAEKKYFKRFATRYWRNSDRHCLSLFEKLTRTEYPDLKKIQKKASPELQKHLPVYLHRLYELILSSLQSFYADTSINAQLYDLLSKVELLHNRGFFEPAGKMLDKARKLAERYEKYPVLAEINQWEKRIIQSTLFEGIKEKELDHLFEKKNDCTKRLNEINEYWKLASLFYLNYRKYGIARTTGEKKFYECLFDDPLLRNKGKLLSPESEMYQLLIYNRYAGAIASFKEVGLYAKQLKDLMEKENHLIVKDPFNYCVANYNYLYALINLKKIKEFYKNLIYFRSIPTLFELKHNKYIQSYITNTSINLELNLIVETGEFEKGILLVKEIDILLPLWRKFNPLFSDFIIENIAYCYFGEGNFREALLINNKRIINEKEDIHNQNRLFELIIHYELGNTELLVSIIRSLYRNLLKRQKLYGTEQLFIDFFRKNTTQLNTRRQQVKAFAELKEALVKLKEDPLEREFLKGFDFVSWLESKIENRPFKTIVREKWSL